jgi:hypothetical protein
MAGIAHHMVLGSNSTTNANRGRHSRNAAPPPLRREGPNPEEAGAGADTKAGCREETDKGAWSSCILRTKRPLAPQNHGQSTQSPLRARRRGLKGASRTTADLSKSSAPGRVASQPAPRNKQAITHLCKIYDIVAQRSPLHKTHLHINVAGRPQIEKDLYCAWLDRILPNALAARLNMFH